VRALERALLAFGLLGLAVFGAAHVDRALATDFSAWAPSRVAAHRDSLLQPYAAPVAVLEIPKLGLEVPVFEGTDVLTLNRGVGLIPGTARPGEDGNTGIAGHRDGFFRGLKDVGEGDLVRLRIGETTREYVVDRVAVVEPDTVKVLQDLGSPTLTLVTCYPFYFIGHAPQRWVVQGSLRALRAAGGRPS
jgi:sortase A